MGKQDGRKGAVWGFAVSFFLFFGGGVIGILFSITKNVSYNPRGRPTPEQTGGVRAAN